MNLEAVHKHSDHDIDSGSIKEAVGRYGLYIGWFVGITFGTDSLSGLCMHAQLSPTLCEPVDWSLPGSSVHEISQAKILKWVAISTPGDLPM